MGARLWRMVEEFRDSQPFPPSIRAIARQAGIAESTFANWRDISKLPEPEHLRAFAAISKWSYAELLDAALIDAGYVRGEVGSDAAPTKKAGRAGQESDDVDELQPPPPEVIEQMIREGKMAAHRTKSKRRRT